MDWNTFIQYSKIFLSGLVASLPSIIAAMGIIINNRRATVRMKDDRKKSFKLGILEEVYKQYDECAREYINIVSSVSSEMIKIQDELIYRGTDNLAEEYKYRLVEAGKKALYLATYRNSLIKALKVNIDADEMAIYLNDTYNKMVVWTNELVMISKLFIITYYETADFDKTINEVIEILRKKVEDIKKNVDLTYELKVYNACFENEYEQKLDKYSEVISSFDDNEKNEISGSMKFLIDKISSSLEEYTQSKKLEQFSSKLSEEIYKLLK